MMKLREISTPNQLEQYLRQFQNFYGDLAYDCGGVIGLLQAVLDNLLDNEDEACQLINGYLTDQQKTFLVKLGEAANLPEGD